MSNKKTLKVYKIKCKRCGYEWIPRTIQPKVCAKCRSPYWDKPRMRRVKK